jgi:hypothetical protein
MLAAAAFGAAANAAADEPLPPWAAIDAATEARVLALVPENISDRDVREVLSRVPAPRIINLQGSVPIVTMAPFAEFLVAMGYPRDRLRNPRDGSLTYNSFVDARQLAGAMAWYYEREGMMPMLIGHSQGGMIAVRVLHELAGDFGDSLPVWNPPRLLLGQWSMLARLRDIPDTAEEFTGFSLEWDPIAGNFGSAEPYRATGSARVRNVKLPAQASHLTLPRTEELAFDPVTRDWINRYVPGDNAPAPPTDTQLEAANLLHAADIWHSVKKHWCLEAQRLIRGRQTRNVPLQ